MVQDLLANDFYTERLYQVTIIFVVSQLSRLSNWFDRYSSGRVCQLSRSGLYFQRRKPEIQCFWSIESISIHDNCRDKSNRNSHDLVDVVLADLVEENPK